MTATLSAADRRQRQRDSVRRRGERRQDVCGPLTAAVLRSLDPHRLLDSGVRDVLVREPVSFGVSPESDACLVRFLRESASCLLRLQWQLGTPGPADASVLAHLPPPLPPARETDGPTARYALKWRRKYGFGHCYYRYGPGFVSIVDVRDPAGAARFILDDSAAVAAFITLTGAVRLATVPPLAADLASQLDEAGLLLRVADWVTVLPFRLKHWPVPCMAV